MTFICRFFVFCCFVTIINLCANIHDSFASGFAVYTQGASALAQGNAVTAHIADPSAVFFNPARIGTLNGTQLQIGSTLIHSSREFNSTGGEDKNVSSNHFPSTFFATHKISPQLSIGVGAFSPFGLGTDWGDTWKGRYISTNSEMTTFNINPVICWQATPTISLAAGFDYMLMDATLEKNLYLAPLLDGHQKFSGDGDGFGFNIGVAVDLTDKTKLGFHYRSEIDMDLDGTAHFTLPGGTPAPIAMMLSNSAGDTCVTLPQQAQLGIAHDFNNKLTAEIGMRWEDWSSFKSLEINLDSGLTSVTERDWKDVYAFNIGGRYLLTDNLALMAGYIYDSNPAPDNTFDPSIPTAKAHSFSFGEEYAFKSLTISVAYTYQHYQSREKNNSVGLMVGGMANGEYQTDNHMIGISLAYRFR
jgi:long-chain fatty acid transport protein